MKGSFDAAIIKSLSGDATINVRGLYKGSEDIPVTFTIFLACNSVPSIDHFDAASRTRLKVIPFENKWARGVDKDIRLRPADEGLKVKLRAEAPGILNWLLKGAADYAKYGFADIGYLEEIEIAADEISADQDPFSVWLDERVENDKNGYLSAGELHDDFRRWMQINRRNEKLPTFANSKIGFSRHIGKVYSLDKAFDAHVKVNKYLVKFK
jgi:putative DNA primase/helicase